MDQEPCSRKRTLRFVPHWEKVRIVMRVLSGETRVSVRESTGIAESTLRGWLNRHDIVTEAEILLMYSTPTSPLMGQSPSTPVMTYSDYTRSTNERSGNRYAASDASTSDQSLDLSSGSSRGVASGSSSDVSSPQSYEESREASDHGGNDQATSSNASRPSKRRRTESDCDDDLPAKRRVNDDDTSSSKESDHTNQESPSADQLADYNRTFRECAKTIEEIVRKAILSYEIYVFIQNLLR